MEDNKLIDGAEYITLEEAKRLKLPYFEGATFRRQNKKTSGTRKLVPDILLFLTL